jgi:proline racemase
MPFSRTLSVVGCHAEGEVGDVIVGGVLDVPGKTMFEKLTHFSTKQDDLRNLLLNEPRGRSSMNCNIILPPCDPRADAGFLIMESEEYGPMSGSNCICTTTVLLETGMIPMKYPVTELALDTAAGLIRVRAECEAGKCKNVTLDNVPAFAFELDYQVDVPDLGVISVDIAWGGVIYVVVKTSVVPGLKVQHRDGPKLVEIGERIKKAIQAVYTPVHPENPGIKGVTMLEWTEPLEDLPDGSGKVATNTVVVSPGRFDRSPCGAGTCARLAIMHARGELEVGEKFVHRSIIGTEFITHIRGTTKVADYDAVLPTIQGRAWITSFKQVVLDSSDPFPEGFRVGDQWYGHE